MSEESIIKRILHFPLTKIITALFVCGGVVAIGQLFSKELLDLTAIDNDLKNFVTGIVVATLSIISYRYLFRFYEKREVSEFSKTGLAKNLILGIILGAVLQSLTIFVIYLFAGYTIVTVNPIVYLIAPLTMAFTSAVFEETLFRGIIFRIVEEKLGSYYSLAISAILFGALHLANPNSSVSAAIGLAIQAGLLLAAAYIYSRNLWFPIAIHFAWNFTETAVFGATVSGHELPQTLITSKISGPEWITGGAFGPEGSVQATLFCLIVTIILLNLSHKQGKIIQPSWKRRIQ